MTQRVVSSHRKSRLGCQECKERKVKCDESRPICLRCKKRRRTCSYQVVAENLPTPSSQGSGQSLLPDISLRPGHGDVEIPQSSPLPLPFEPVRHTVFADAWHHGLYYSERFSLFQFSLLSHFRGPLIDDAVRFHQDELLLMAYKEAFKAPYLMDQLLAFSAAHASTSTHNEGLRSTYETEAIRLQTRALSQMSEKDIEVTDDNVLALFYFSLLVGQQTLFDLFSSTFTVPTVLDRLSQCLTLHRGIRTIVAKSNGKFEELLSQQHPHDPIYSTPDVAALPHGSECDGLLQRLQDSDNTDATKTVYTDVVGILRYLFNSARSDAARKYIVIQEWPVRVSDEYSRLLRQRQPEALVLLSYYAVLLHWAKDYWAVRDSGSLLISSISDHLGECWADWLEWPKSQACVDPSSLA